LKDGAEVLGAHQLLAKRKDLNAYSFAKIHLMKLQRKTRRPRMHGSASTNLSLLARTNTSSYSF